jgi:hypothetical protein
MVENPTDYTMEHALEEAYGLLESRFGKVDQSAAVALAAAILNAKPRDEFLKRRADSDEIPMGGGITQ